MGEVTQAEDESEGPGQKGVRGVGLTPWRGAAAGAGLET
jgi:hypothetical protein